MIVTGAPGSGKTTALGEVRETGIEVVVESATDVNQQMLDVGLVPHEQPEFLECIVALQRERRLAATAERQLHDRSVFCTLALARHLGAPVPAALWAEIDDVVGWFEPVVLFVAPLGFVTPTTVRRIGYADAQRFGLLHRQVYTEYGFTIEDVPVGAPGVRAAAFVGAVWGRPSSVPAGVARGYR